MTPEAWLAEHAVHGEDVLSWVNPEHPGYAYPEAAGLLVRWLAMRELPVPQAVADDLATRALDDAVGRDGLSYAFDTGVVLAGLEALDAKEDPRWSDARARLADRLAARTVVTSVVGSRWSSVPGPHMLKLAVGALARARRGWPAPTLDVLVKWPVEQDAAGRLFTPPHESTYMHAHAYATEGLLALEAAGHDPPASIGGAVAFLRAVQRPDGGIPAWHDHGPPHADATAQAVRLFVLHDPTEFRDAITGGLEFLGTLTDEHGVVRYAPGSGDRNTWCTLFAAQARAWANGSTPPRVEDLL